MGYVKKPTFINPPLKLPSNVSTDGRCGPAFGNKVCPGETCCSQYGWCGANKEQRVLGVPMDNKEYKEENLMESQFCKLLYPIIKITHQLILVESRSDNSRDHSYVLKQDSRLNQHVNHMDLIA